MSSPKSLNFIFFLSSLHVCLHLTPLMLEIRRSVRVVVHRCLGALWRDLGGPKDLQVLKSSEVFEVWFVSEDMDILVADTKLTVFVYFTLQAYHGFLVRLEPHRSVWKSLVRWSWVHGSGTSRCTSGSNVCSYFAWSLVGNVVWAVGYIRRFGLACLEYNSYQRKTEETSEVVFSVSCLWYMESRFQRLMTSRRNFGSRLLYTTIF